MGESCVPAPSAVALDVPLVSWSGPETCLGETVPERATSSLSSQSILLETPIRIGEEPAPVSGAWAGLMSPYSIGPGPSAFCPPTPRGPNAEDVD